MANKVSYIIELQNRFSRNAKKISKNMKTIDKSADKASRTIDKKLSKSFLSLGGAAKNAFGAIAAGFSLKLLIDKGAEFQDAMADLSAITGEAGEQLSFLSDESFRLARASSIAQADVVRAFTDIASAKSELLKDPKGLSIVTEQSLLLANAAGIAVPDAIRASVGALNQFGEGADQAARFVNVIAAGAKVGASRVGETAEALKNAGTVASQFGLSFEQTNAIIQVFAKSELKAAEAGTALRGTLSKLEKFMGGKFAPSRIGIVQSLEAINKLGLSNTEIIKEFGEENLRSILILRQNVPLIKQWTKELTGTNIAQEQAEKRLSTFNAKMRQLGVLVNEQIIKTFIRLEPVITKQVEALSRFIDSIDPKQVDAFGDSIAGLASALGLLANVIQVPLSLLKALGTSVGELSAGFAIGDFSEELSTSLADKFSIGGDLFGIFDRGNGGSASTINAPIPASKADVNVNLRAPEGVIESVKTKTTGKSSGLNVGVNMAEAI